MRNMTIPIIVVSILLLLVLGELLIRRRAEAPVGSWPTRPLPALDPQATRIVVLADSIAFGEGLPEEQAWPEVLEARLQRSYPDRTWQVVNAGVPGDTVADAYTRFDAHVKAYRPHLLLIAFGINDCLSGQDELTNRRLAQFAVNERSGWGRLYLLRALRARLRPLPIGLPDPTAPEVPPEAFQSVLAWLVRQGQKEGAVVALLTMTPVDPPRLGDAGDYIVRWKEYSTLVRDTARSLGVPFIEVGHKLPGDNPWQADGVHLTAAGEAAIANRVWQALHRPGLAPTLRLHGGDSNAEMAPSLD